MAPPAAGQNKSFVKKTAFSALPDGRAGAVSFISRENPGHWGGNPRRLLDFSPQVVYDIGC